MARNFDDVLSQDREFTVRGEKFSFQDVRPEVLSGFEISTNGDEELSVWKVLTDQILLFLPTADHERWLTLRERETEPVTIAQLQEIIKWLVEAQTGRPTEAPLPSASGRGKTAGSSKGA
jgi:hypothetical protein